MIRRMLSGWLIAAFCATLGAPTPVQAREMSRAGQVFQDVKAGVVTVFVSYTHGSGALVDPAGLILTNNHVARENNGDLRVKFGPLQVVRADVLVQDREHDLAVLWVNLQNIPNPKVLPLFAPSEQEPLALVGEQIIAVGSPVDRDILEKTMTLGVVGKVDDVALRHDASLNGGNSGGPLLNYDGQIIGVNTFLMSERGPGIGNAIPITRAAPLLASARALIAEKTPPDPTLLPDVPTLRFPIGELLREHPEAFPKRSDKDYSFDSTYFSVSALTPPQGYRQALKAEDRVLKKRRKRARKKGFEVSDDERDTRNIANYDYTRPVVTLMVMPRPKLTTGSKVINTITFLLAAGATAASFGASAPLLFTPFVMGRHEVKKDFLKMTLADSSGQKACSPIEAGRQPFTENIAALTNRAYVDYIDKSYVGIYSFDAKCFETPHPLRLTIDIEGARDADRVMTVPERVKRAIVADFKPYWAYAGRQSAPAAASPSAQASASPANAP